jgi:N-acetylglucosamine-6-phosphate deacetylase
MPNLTAIIGGSAVLADRIISQSLVLIQEDHLGYVGPLEEERIPAGAQRVDARGLRVLPGLIDTHVHGSHGSDLMLHGAAGIRRIAEAFPRYGTTAWLPTTISAVHEDLLRVVRECVESRDHPDGAAIVGIHVEGPYINLKRKGAQPAEGIRDPDLGQAGELLAAGEGLIRMVTLAPELPGGEELIRYLVERDVIASLGHSDATYDEAMAGITAGATHATHLFNAMRPLHHRDPGIIAGCLMESELTVEIIPDGVHLHPETVQLCLRNKAIDRVCVITDAISATGLGDGIYTLGPHKVRVTSPLCSLDDGTIAGSVLTMDRAVRNVVTFAKASLVDAVRMSSLVPARLAGCVDSKGSLDAGKDADVTLFDDEFRCIATWVRGRLAYRTRALSQVSAQNHAA